MATNTLATRSDGDTITEDFFNDYKSSLSGTFVPRNTSGVPEGSTQSCGSAAFPWSTVFADGLVIGGSAIDVCRKCQRLHIESYQAQQDRLVACQPL